MLFCTRCGQSIYINNENFREFRATSGWEEEIIDAETLDHVEWGESETTDSVHESYVCPFCDSEDVDYVDSSDELRERATELREGYNSERQEILNGVSYLLPKVKEQPKDSDWDNDENA